MDEQPLDERLQAAAREYHRPPEVPREAMWRAIERQRRGDRLRGGGWRRRLPWTGAAAAAILVAAGVGIGRLTAPAPAGPAVTTRTAGPAARPVNETAYRLATLEHLEHSEAFLTLFRASLRAGSEAPIAPGAARQLLVTNRLLLDSPAAQDRRTRLLLEDLELVLAEIAQLSADTGRSARELVRDGIERGDVLTRLRTVVPAGTAPTRGNL